MKPTRWPTWLLVVFGIVAIVAGVLGVIHAPPVVAKVFWTIITVSGLLSLAFCVWRARTPEPRL